MTNLSWVCGRNFPHVPGKKKNEFSLWTARMAHSAISGWEFTHGRCKVSSRGCNKCTEDVELIKFNYILGHYYWGLVGCHPPQSGDDDAPGASRRPPHLPQWKLTPRRIIILLLNVIYFPYNPLGLNRFYWNG